MGILALTADERVVDVKFTGIPWLSNCATDERSPFPWLGIPACSTPPQRSERTGASRVGATASTGPTSMRI